MIKKTLAILAATILIAFFSFSQDHRQRYKDCSAKGDTTGMAQALKEWETASPKDPEMFIGYFNYFIRMASREMISLGPNNKGEGFQLTDSTGKPAGYLTSSANYDPRILQQGFNYIDKGISLHPTRLDMRFGKVYMFGKAENYGAFTKTIIETIDFGNTINNAWLWKEGKPLDNPKKFFLSTIQDYQSSLYNTEDDQLLPYMREIAEAMLKYYPDHVESLANVAITYLVIGEYDKGLPYLLKAEIIAPKDIVVLNNIAQVYKRKNDKVNTKIYLQKIIKYGSKEEVEIAKEQMKELQ